MAAPTRSKVAAGNRNTRFAVATHNMPSRSSRIASGCAPTDTVVRLSPRCVRPGRRRSQSRDFHRVPHADSAPRPEVRCGRRGTPVDEADAIESDQTVSGGQPQITIPRLRERVNKCGWDAVFARPDRVRVLRQRLVGIRRAGAKREQDQAHARTDTTSPTARREWSSGHGSPILPSRQHGNSQTAWASNRNASTVLSSCQSATPPGPGPR